LSQTENPETNSDERIRKIYVKDLKLGEGIHTVFRAARKEKHTSRGGKSFLALTLVDRTGEIDGRVFENVGAADQAFSPDDYLLVKGKVDQFKGKPQVVVERLERLDPGPIEASEFAYTPAPPPPAQEKHEKPAREEPKVHLSRRLARLLENPQVAQALDALAAQLEKAIEKQVEERHGKTGAPAQRTERPDRPDRKPRGERGPRVEHKPHAENVTKAAEPRRDPSLPEGLAFKPFNALVPGGEGEKPAAEQEAKPAETADSPESSPS
jgi:RecG-like helicase